MKNSGIDFGQSFTYDMTFSTHSRINYWFWRCNEHSFDDDAVNWWKALKIILRETKPVMKQADLLLSENIVAKIKPEYKKYCNFILQQSASNQALVFVRSALFDLLEELESQCRQSLTDAGIMFKKGDEAIKAMA